MKKEMWVIEAPGDKVAQIKVYRALTALGLKESKDYCDQFWKLNELGVSQPFENVMVDPATTLYSDFLIAEKSVYHQYVVSRPKYKLYTVMVDV